MRGIRDDRRSGPSVDESVVIAAPAHEAEARARWWGHLELDASVGGRFEERWTDGSGARRPRFAWEPWGTYITATDPDGNEVQIAQKPG
jgi:hypothetical protein